MMSVAERVMQIAVEHYESNGEYGFDTRSITPQMRFFKELPDVSLEIVELFLRCEEAFDVEISDEEASTLETLGDLSTLIEAKLRDKPLWPGHVGL